MKINDYGGECQICGCVVGQLVEIHEVVSIDDEPTIHLACEQCVLDGLYLMKKAIEDINAPRR